MSISIRSRIEIMLGGADIAFDPLAFDISAFDAAWTDISDDVLGQVSARYGIQGNGPKDGTASGGELHFDLDNSAQNAGATLGWYSPASASVRAGWTYGVTVRWVLTYSGTDYTRFRGKVGSIQPDPGLAMARRVHVVVYDHMRDLMDADVRQVTTQISKNENDLITAVLAALPSSSQPPATSFDSGLDTYAYAFDNVRGGVKAGTLLNDIVLSSFGALYTKGDGTLVYKTRRSRSLAVSAATLSDTMRGLTVPSTLDGIFNRVRAVIHPKTVDAAATTVLWAQTGTAPSLSPGSSTTIWGTYRDPTNTLKLIGATAQVTPIVSTTDYTANSASDGSGSDLTANMSVVTTAFATTVQFVVTNTGTATLYVTKLQIRGKGIYDNGPRTFENYVAQSYGDRPVTIDLPYQDDAAVAQDIAAYIAAQFGNLTQQISDVTFWTQASAALATAALTLEPTDVVTLTETVSGLSAVKVVIQGVEFVWNSAKELLCKWRLAPSSPFTFWQLGTAGASELGQTTVLGF